MYVTGNRNAARKGGKRMAEILTEIYSWISFVPKITFKNLIEIAIIAILVYEMLIWIKNTRAWTLLKGIVLFLHSFWQLRSWNWIRFCGFWKRHRTLR